MSRKLSCRAHRIVALGCAAVVATLVAVQPAGAQTAVRRVSAWIPTWDQANGLSSFTAQKDQYSDVSPFWYGMNASGAIVAYPNAESSTLITAVRNAGVNLIPSIDNQSTGARVSTMLADATRRNAHVQALVSLVDRQGYDGLDVDYENLASTDRDRFTTFVRELASALHTRNKSLSITVHPKTSEPGTWNGPQAQNYAAIGAAADLVRIMAYDYSWSGSAPGPIAPAGWVDDVARFAASVIPPSKIQLGLPLYGYDWSAGQGTGVTHAQVQSLISRYSATVQWSSTHSEPWFTYRDASGVGHTVWFNDARSIAVKLASVTRYGLRGVVFWRLGGEDPAVWSKTRAQFGGSPPASDLTPPAVTIMAPKPNARLSGTSQRVDYRASDDRRVVTVRLYLDGRLVASGTAAVGSFKLATGSLKVGKHLITVKAIDAAGNAKNANVYVVR